MYSTPEFKAGQNRITPQRLLEGIRTAVSCVFYGQDELSYLTEGVALATFSLVRKQKHLPLAASAILLSAGAIQLAEELIRVCRRGLTESGVHMTIIPRTYMGFRPRQLKDGTRLIPGQLVGEIHYYHDMYEASVNESVTGRTRTYFTRAKGSLEQLANLCQSGDPRVEGVGHFVGRSHIAGALAERLGFELFPIDQPYFRWMANFKSKGLVKDLNFNNTKWLPLSRNLKDAREAVISRASLIELYATR